MRKLSGKYLIIAVAFIGIMGSCQQGNKNLLEGNWRGVFIVPGNEIPFTFEVVGKRPDSTSIFLINGEDRFQLNKIQYQNDSVFIPIDLYDAVLKAKFTDNSIQGRFVKLGTEKPDSGVPFKAKFGNFPRFPESGEVALFSLTGTWDVFIGTGEQAKKAVGIFEQNESQLTGSILTKTGDYRFLEGVAQGNNFQLSAFGGSTPYLIKGEFAGDTIFVGEFITPRQTDKIEGKRNPNAELPNAYNVTFLKEGFSSLEFSFPNMEGKLVSLSDSIYKGKVVIVTILGSWCPNCLDENAFLSEWYKENKERGVEIIGLGFERKNDFEFAKISLTNLINRLDIEYEILFAGQSGTESASKALPALNGIFSFPTTIFIDKNGHVRKVHSGFNGPATGKFYEEFKAEFNEFVNELLAEKGASPGRGCPPTG